MLDLNIKDEKGNIVDVIQLPQSCKEIKLLSFVDFEHYISTNTEKLKGTQLDVIEFCLSAIREFYKNDNVKLLPLGKFEDMVKGEIINENAASASLLEIFSYLVSMVRDFKTPAIEPFDFELDGCKFSLRKYTRQIITGRLKLEDLPTWHAAEALEAKRVYEENKDSEHSNSYRYSYLLWLMAALLKSELPFDESFRVLQNVDMETALKVESFFFNGGKVVKMNSDSNTSSNRRRRLSKRWKKVKR